MADAESGFSFAERLDSLFKRVRPGAGKSEYSYEQVAEGVRAKGFDISAAYVWQLRKGQRDNPTLRHILGLAGFFGVPAGYFVDDDVREKVDAQIDVLMSMRDAGVKDVALRAHGLSESSLAAISGMIEHVRRLEQLPIDAEADGNDE